MTRTAAFSAISGAAAASIGKRFMAQATDEPKVEFNRERFEALVLYIAWKTRDDPEFGRTKLAKVLFYADLETYAATAGP